MPKYITKEEVIETDSLYKEIFKRENPDHPIIKDNYGVLRWKKDPMVEMLFEYKALDLNALFINGASKNDPRVRELYRKMGYSLFGYWEVFHWEMNNPEADQYKE